MKAIREMEEAILLDVKKSNTIQTGESLIVLEKMEELTGQNSRMGSRECDSIYGVSRKVTGLVNKAFNDCNQENADDDDSIPDLIPNNDFMFATASSCEYILKMLSGTTRDNHRTLDIKHLELAFYSDVKKSKLLKEDQI